MTEVVSLPRYDHSSILLVGFGGKWCAIVVIPQALPIGDSNLGPSLPKPLGSMLIDLYLYASRICSRLMRNVTCLFVLDVGTRDACNVFFFFNNSIVGIRGFES
jgi:hypothetical protein